MAEIINTSVIITTIVVSLAMLVFTIQNLRHTRRKSYDEFIEKRKKRH